MCGLGPAKWETLGAMAARAKSAKTVGPAAPALTGFVASISPRQHPRACRRRASARSQPLTTLPRGLQRPPLLLDVIWHWPHAAQAGFIFWTPGSGPTLRQCHEKSHIFIENEWILWVVKRWCHFLKVCFWVKRAFWHFGSPSKKPPKK